MTRILPIALLGLAGLVALGSTGPRSPAKASGSGAVESEIRDGAGRLEWPILPDFLVAVAWTESRLSPLAANASGRKGVFQLTPSSALVDDLAGFSSNRLFEVPFAVVAAAYYTKRLAKYRGKKPLDELNGLDIRRGWAYPTLVDDYAETEQRSRDVRRRLAQAEEATGVSVASRLVFPPGWSWIGTTEAMRRTGAA